MNLGIVLNGQLATEVRQRSDGYSAADLLIYDNTVCHILLTTKRAVAMQSIHFPYPSPPHPSPSLSTPPHPTKVTSTRSVGGKVWFFVDLTTVQITAAHPPAGPIEGSPHD